MVVSYSEGCTYIPAGATMLGCQWYAKIYTHYTANPSHSMARDPVPFPHPEMFDFKRWLDRNGRQCSPLIYTLILTNLTDRMSQLILAAYLTTPRIEYVLDNTSLAGHFIDCPYSCGPSKLNKERAGAPIDVDAFDESVIFILQWHPLDRKSVV